MILAKYRLGSFVIASCVLLIWSPAYGQEVRYDGHKSVRVDVKTQAQLDALIAAGGIIQNCHYGIGPVDVVVSPEQLTAIEQLGLPLRILHDDVQACP